MATVGRGHLVEYVALYEADEERFLRTGTGMSGYSRVFLSACGPNIVLIPSALLCRNLGSALLDANAHIPAKLALKLPDADHKHQIFPPSLELFAFPEGISLKTTRPPSSSHMFVCTLEDGASMYAYCLTNWYTLPDRQLKTVRMQIAARLMSDEDASVAEMPTVVFAPRVLLLLTAHPLHTGMLWLLDALARQHCAPCLSDPIMTLTPELLQRQNKLVSNGNTGNEKLQQPLLTTPERKKQSGGYGAGPGRRMLGFLTNRSFHGSGSNEKAANGVPDETSDGAESMSIGIFPGYSRPPTQSESRKTLLELAYELHAVLGGRCDASSSGDLLALGAPPGRPSTRGVKGGTAVPASGWNGCAGPARR